MEEEKKSETLSQTAEPQTAEPEITGSDILENEPQTEEPPITVPEKVYKNRYERYYKNNPKYKGYFREKSKEYYKTHKEKCRDLQRRWAENCKFDGLIGYKAYLIYMKSVRDKSVAKMKTIDLFSGGLLSWL